MNIRFAKEKDINQFIELCKAHAIYEKASFNPNNKREALLRCLFQSNNILKCIVVELNNELLGYASFMKQFSTWDAEFYIYLDCLFIKEQTRGKGIGKQLMNQIKRYAKNEKCKLIQWQTPDFNTDAIQFYTKIGAISKSKERFFWEV